MSHATVVVKMTTKRLAAHDGDLQKALDAMMAPYDENTEDKKLLVFKEDPDCEPDTTAGGQRGYWYNPNRKWDWFVIGGRWSGFFPAKLDERGEPQGKLGQPGAFDNRAKPGRVDVIRAADIDWTTVEADTKKAVDAFWTDYQALLNGKRFDVFDGPRHQALDVGLITIVPGPAVSNESQKALPWSNSILDPRDERRSWHDVAKIVERAAVDALAPSFSPITPFAALDNDGWHAPGTLGWFGNDDAKSDDRVAFDAAFVDRFIKTAAEDDLLIAVDYHI